MTHEQIRDAIRSGWPFFGVSRQGQVLARYVPFGPVFRWKQNQMIPTPLQGEDRRGGCRRTTRMKPKAADLTPRSCAYRDGFFLLIGLFGAGGAG